MMRKVLLLILIAVIPQGLLFSLERVQPPATIEELCDPKSGNYVPFPYPLTREHVIADFKHWVRKTNSWAIDLSSRREKDIYDRLLPELLKKDSTHRIGRVYKVYNQTHGIAYGYHYVLEVLDSRNGCWGRAAVSAQGLLMMFGLNTGPMGTGPSLSPRKAREVFRQAGCVKSGKAQGGLKRIGFNTLARNPICFAWRLKINGEEYYLQDSPVERKLYRVSSRRRWCLDRKSNFEMAVFARSLPEGDEIIIDSINDQVMVATPVQVDIKTLLKQTGAG